MSIAVPSHRSFTTYRPTEGLADIIIIGSLGSYASNNTTTFHDQRWKFIKENKKTRFPPRKKGKKRKHVLTQEKSKRLKKENTLTTNKKRKKKHLDHVIDQVKKQDLTFFFYLLPAQSELMYICVAAGSSNVSAM